MFMTAKICDETTGAFLREEEIDLSSCSECEHFCDTCGDCLACYGGEDCCYADNSKHLFVIYEKKATT